MRLPPRLPTGHIPTDLAQARARWNRVRWGLFAAILATQVLAAVAAYAACSSWGPAYPRVVIGLFGAVIVASPTVSPILFLGMCWGDAHHRAADPAYVRRLGPRRAVRHLRWDIWMIPLIVGSLSSAILLSDCIDLIVSWRWRPGSELWWGLLGLVAAGLLSAGAAWAQRLIPGRVLWACRMCACSHCGYDLRGSRGPQCPECGAAVMRPKRKPQPRRRRKAVHQSASDAPPGGAGG